MSAAMENWMTVLQLCVMLKPDIVDDGVTQVQIMFD
jgi:hypothetical protein